MYWLRKPVRAPQPATREPPFVPRWKLTHLGIPPIEGARRGTVGTQQPKGPMMITKCPCKLEIKGGNSHPRAHHYRILSDAVRVGGNACIPDNLSCVGVQWSICRPPVHRIRRRGCIRQLGLTGGRRENPEDMRKAAIDFLGPGLQRQGERGTFSPARCGVNGSYFPSRKNLPTAGVSDEMPVEEAVGAATSPRTHDIVDDNPPTGIHHVRRRPC